MKTLLLLSLLAGPAFAGEVSVTTNGKTEIVESKGWDKIHSDIQFRCAEKCDENTCFQKCLARETTRVAVRKDVQYELWKQSGHFRNTK